MENRLKISVVLPVYNCEKYLARSIESVRKQTYDNWELIIVNDGSRDASERKAREFVKKDKRIKLINQENKGVSVARNLGIEEAAGDILMFLDADDWFEENAFEEVVANWDNSMQMLLFDYYDVAGNGKKQYRKHFRKDRIVFGKERSMEELELTISGFYTEQKGTATVIESPWGRAYRTDYIKEKQLEFPQGIFMCEDQVFNLKAVTAMNHVLYLSKAIYNYYINMESVSGSVYGKCGDKLISNMVQRNRYVGDIFFEKHSELFETAYYKYVFEGIKVILWWLADERDKDKKVLGRNYCYSQVAGIRKYTGKEYGFADRMLLALCERKCFAMIEVIVSMRKRVKRVLNIR